MSNILFKEIVKMVSIFAVIGVILLFAVFGNKPMIAIAFLTGIFLGILRLKAFFDYLSSVIDPLVHKSGFLLLKYILSLFLSLGIMGIALYKVQTIGFSILFGIILVPIVLTIYSIWHGILLYRKS